MITHYMTKATFFFPGTKQLKLFPEISPFIEQLRPIVLQTPQYSDLSRLSGHLESVSQGNAVGSWCSNKTLEQDSGICGSQTDLRLKVNSGPFSGNFFMKSLKACFIRSTLGIGLGQD